MRRLLLALSAVLLVIAGCGDDDEPVSTGEESRTTTSAPATVPASGDEQARLDAARAAWTSAGIDDYELRWMVQCFCPVTAYVDTIVGGEVVDHRPADDTGPVVDDPGPKTMEDVFDEVRESIDSSPHELSVDYDPETGAVRSYWVDPVENAADEEYGLELTLRTQADAGPAAEVTAVELTEHHACGFGFQASTPDQTVGLFLSRQEPATSGTVTLPAEGWEPEVRIGEDLFSNWCDDVLEPGEPEPEVTERWAIVAGRLEVSVPDQLQREATVVATDLVAERPDGSRVELGDTTITNRFYGTVAG